MPIEFRCPSCTRILRTPDESAGKKARCPECGAVVDIPLQSAPLAASDVGANQFAESGFIQPADSIGAAATKSSANPYSAPTLGIEAKASDLEPTNLVELRHSHESLEDLLRLSWQLFKHQFWMAVVLGLVTMGLAGIGGMFGQIIAMIGMMSRNMPLYFVGIAITQIINVFVQTWIQLGLTKACLRWARTGELQVGDLFAVRRSYGRGLALMALMTAVFLAILAVCAIPVLISIPYQNGPASIGLGAVGFLVYFTCAVLIWLSMFLSFPLIVDRQLGVFESLRVSSQFMSGNRFNVFLMLFVVAIGTLVGTFCTCFVGIVLAPAVQSLFSVVAYLRITGQSVFEPPPRIVESSAPAADKATTGHTTGPATTDNTDRLG